jgi:hypothetical protein
LAVPFDDPQFSIRFQRNARHPQRCIRRTLHRRIGHCIDVEKISDGLDLDTQAPAAGLIKPDGWKHTAGMLSDGRAVRIA